MKHSTFGDIEWQSDAWQGSLEVPYFDGFGKSVEGAEAAQGRFGVAGVILPLEIHTINDVRKPPSKAQHEAFLKLTRGGDKTWADVMAALTAEYKKQLPKRLRYWKNMYGARGIKKSLPPVKGAGALKPLVMPGGLHVRAETGKEAIVDIDVVFALSWFSDGAFVTIRGGRTAEVNGLPSWLSHSWRERIDDPVFGTLRRPKRGPSWLGTTGAGAFADWAAISVNRATWDENASERQLDSNLDWPMARGDCFVRVHVAGDKGPSTRQAAAFESFKKDENVAGRAIKDALLAFYQANFKALKSGYKGPNASRAIPKVANADDLSDISELYLLHVFPEHGEHPLTIGLVFRGAWTGQAGIGIRWREGQIEEIGEGEVATPTTR